MRKEYSHTSNKELTAKRVTSGPPVSPADRIKLYDADQWEEFIKEWAESLSSEYCHVERLGGAGDQGRDVIACTAEPNTDCPWDNYQCKHYRNSLAPNDIWCELGKLCYYTFERAYLVPRKYYFVAPQGVGVKLYDLLSKPEKLKRELISKWDTKCKSKIVSNKQVVLEGAFKRPVENFDFSIVWYKKISEIIEQHKKTSHYITRFGEGLPPRPVPESPPPGIQKNEARYVNQLLGAYSDASNEDITSVDKLESGDYLYRRHFDRSRERFYCAESLRVFSNDTLPQGEFEKLQDEVYDGVIDTVDSDHDNAFEKVKATTVRAMSLAIHSHPLKDCLRNNDKSGICHQLVNDSKLTWVSDDDKNG